MREKIQRGSVRYEIYLVEGEYRRLVPRADFLQDPLRGLAKLVRLRIRRVHDMDEYVRERGLLQGGLEGFDEPRGRFRTKPTVSVAKSPLPGPNTIRRVVGSSVANSLSSARACALVMAFRRLDFRRSCIPPPPRAAIPRAHGASAGPGAKAEPFSALRGCP